MAMIQVSSSSIATASTIARFALVMLSSRVVDDVLDCRNAVLSLNVGCCDVVGDLIGSCVGCSS